ncbi:MAG: DUF362 domain-containing protein [Deltaproteobacteria bacterium]
MKKSIVGVVRYEKPLESVRKAVEISSGLDRLSPSDRVFIKPNIPFWTPSVDFPKWGVITTSRVVEEMVVLLKEHGVNDITIGEGMVTFDPRDRETARHAFESLGYRALGRRYGVKCIHVFERPFEKIDLGDGVRLNFNTDILNSDFVVNIPVLKTHVQTIVSLGIKNIKGTIDVNSRKKCHNADPEKDLNFMVSRLADPLPPSFTIVDGIYSTERGPGFEGKIRRSNILIASQDTLAADMVGAKVMGYEPSGIPYISHAATRGNRPLDLSDIEIAGEPIEAVASPHEHSFPYNERGTLPVPLEKMGIKGIAYPQYDLTLCTYCSMLTGTILAAIASAWKGVPWDDVEILSGKIMKPTPGKKTILLGKCLYQANKDHPDIGNMIAIKTCPPSPKAIADALRTFGVDVDPAMLEHFDEAPARFMRKYEGNAEFDVSFFKIAG